MVAPLGPGPTLGGWLQEGGLDVGVERAEGIEALSLIEISRRSTRKEGEGLHGGQLAPEHLEPQRRRRSTRLPEQVHHLSVDVHRGARAPASGGSEGALGRQP